jgi:DNA-binding LacI/PurR family transcriptional regulator
VQPLLTGRKHVDAIIEVDAAATLVAAQACRALNLRAPPDVPVLGVNALPEALSRGLAPAHFAQPLEAMAAWAAELTLVLRQRSRTFAPEPIPIPAATAL